MKFLDRFKKLKAVPFSHTTMLTYLSDYKNPNDKIKQMLKSGELIRVKQSLYVLGKPYNDQLVSKELIANLIYGPSYISMDYALSYYGLIPERVYTVTSMTPKMLKRYKTPFGEYVYIKSSINLYSVGITMQQNLDATAFMIASKEKALCDKIIFTKNLQITSLKLIFEYLEFDLRLDFNELKHFDLNIINECIKCNYKVKLLKLLLKAIDKIKAE